MDDRNAAVVLPLSSPLDGTYVCSSTMLIFTISDVAHSVLMSSRTDSGLRKSTRIATCLLMALLCSPGFTRPDCTPCFSTWRIAASWSKSGRYAGLGERHMPVIRAYAKGVVPVKLGALPAPAEVLPLLVG